LFDEISVRGHEVIVFRPDENRSTGNPIEAKRGEVSVISVPTGRITKTGKIVKSINMALLEQRYMRAIKKYLKKPADLVVYSTPPITFVNLIRKLKEEMSCSSYLLLKDIFPQNSVDLGMMSEKSILYKILRRKERALYKISDRIGCMSPANVKYLLEHNDFIESSKVHENPNSIKPSEGKKTSIRQLPILKNVTIPANALKMVYGGNFGLPQGVNFILEALKALACRDDVYTILVGDGTEFDKISRFIENEKINNAHLLKSLPKADYIELLAHMDVGLIFLDHRFTIPNFPSRVLDYMDAGLPIISVTDPNTDIGTIITQAGAGLWCESNDIHGFLTCVDTMKKDKIFCMSAGEASKQLLLDRYTASHSADIILDTINESC
jgi:glycosyltransferase involved in cell wall biosynthesis